MWWSGVSRTAAGRSVGPTDDHDDGLKVADADRLPLGPEDILRLTQATAAGDLVVFPAETVYGLAADPDRPAAVHRMAALKGRDPGKPSSVLFWSVASALDALDGVPDVVARAVAALLPGPIGLIVPNPRERFAVACGDAPRTLGIRVPLLAAPVVAPPVVQTSANRAGEPDPRTVEAVPCSIREACALVLDRGPRPGRPSTVVDLRGLREGTPGGWHVVREGPVSRAEIAAALGHPTN